MKTALILPNQLFNDIEKIKNCNEIIIYEHPLFFTQFKFHKQKLIFHRASMKAYAAYLKEKKLKIKYINYNKKLPKIKELIA